MGWLEEMELNLALKSFPDQNGRSTSEELAPSLAGMQTSTESSVHDGTLLEDPVAESSLLGGAVSGVAGHAERDSRDRLPRTD
jgi:hypothetical protein